MDVELVTLIANLGALSIAGILYVAYIKNLRSQVSLKEEQIRTAEQNTKLWKDKALELERQTPHYVEQVLADRIRILADEIARLSNDEMEHQSIIEQKNVELDQLRVELETANNFGRGISVFDSETRDLRQLSAGDLTLVDLGEIWVDTASIIICDPWHFRISREREIEEHPVFEFMYRETESGEVLYLNDENQHIFIKPHEDFAPAKQLVEMGYPERLDPPEELPADPDTYIKGNTVIGARMGKSKSCTFYNGTSGAGMVFGTGGDGRYKIRGESYKGIVRRIFIDLKV